MKSGETKVKNNFDWHFAIDAQAPPSHRTISYTQYPTNYRSITQLQVPTLQLFVLVRFSRISNDLYLVGIGLLLKPINHESEGANDMHT